MGCQKVPSERRSEDTSLRHCERITTLHVALQPARAIRSTERPGHVILRGLLLYDTGTSTMVKSVMPLAVFWKMQAIGFLALARHHDEAVDAIRQRAPVSNVWSVEGVIDDDGTLNILDIGSLDLVSITQGVTRVIATVSAQHVLPWTFTRPEDLR